MKALSTLLFLSLFMLNCDAILAQRCTKYVKYQGKNLALKGVKLKESISRSIEVDLGDIEIRNDWRWASDEIQHLDLLQYTICQQLKCMKKNPARPQTQAKYVEALIKMMNLVFAIQADPSDSTHIR